MTINLFQTPEYKERAYRKEYRLSIQ